MSGISYGNPTHGKPTVQSKALGDYKAICEHFKQDGVNILTEGFADVLSSPVSFGELKEKLTEGVREEDRESMLQLIENTRLSMLQESTIAGTNPITALSLPMLRVGWAKIAVREGLPTEPVEQPKFKVTIKKPYVRLPNGEKRFLPAALTGDDAFQHTLPKLELTPIAATNGAIVAYDLLAPIGKNVATGDQIDPNFRVTEVEATFPTGGKQKVSVNLVLDTNINVVQGEVTFGIGAAKETATLLGKVNREAGIMDVALIGAVLEKVTIAGFVTSEANNSATQIGFDIDGEDITIGTAQPIESPINIQHMTDVMALYNIDATLSHIETMTTFLAHATDLEGVQFIDDVFNKLPQADRIEEEFDVVAPSNYALGDVAWREQIKAKFDRIVTRLQTSANIYSGHTVLFCHPLDAQVIANVKWVYSAGEQVNDVAVGYQVGQYISGTTSYLVLQSPYFKQGKVRVVFVPADPEHKTLVYYPYSFSTVRGTTSSSPNAGHVPSIQMIKRHLFKSFTPLVGMVNIKNNGV